jgi:hypothetical protein
MPGAISLGHSINPPTDDEIKTSESVFQKVWEGSRRQYISNGIPYTCQCNVCPPFGNRINFFLSEIKNNTEKYGVESIKEALKKLRTKYS